MLIGSAIKVTYMSDIAILTINIDCTVIVPFDLAVMIKIRAFPNVPTRDAKVCKTIHVIAKPGDS